MRLLLQILFVQRRFSMKHFIFYVLRYMMAVCTSHGVNYALCGTVAIVFWGWLDSMRPKLHFQASLVLLFSKSSGFLTLRPFAEPVLITNPLLLLYSPFCLRVLPLATMAFGKLTCQTVYSK